MIKGLVDFFENAPIYGWFNFPAGNGDAFMHSYLDFEIEILCPKCKEKKPFLFKKRICCDEDGYVRSDGFTPSPIIVASFYHCAKCKTYKLILVHFSRVKEPLDKYIIVAQKIGEYPRPLLNYDRSLDNLFEKDKILFHNALKCMNDGLGVGAFAYLRQPLEGCIEILLDEVRKQAEEGKDIDTVNRIDDLKKAPASKKIELAKDVMPPYLRFDGLNPLGTLYQVCSEAIHHYTDEECLAKAKDVYSCLTFLAGTIADHKKRRESFRNTVASLKDGK